VLRLVDATHRHDSAAAAQATTNLHAMQQRDAANRAAASVLIRRSDPTSDGSDTNYVFLTFVLQSLPVGTVGLVLAAILCAAMSATSSGLNSLASTSVIDLLRRFAWRDATDRQYVHASKLMTVLWGLFAIGFAEFASRLGSLIEAGTSSARSSTERSWPSSSSPST
jgi:Na+/proline symporter